MSELVSALRLDLLVKLGLAVLLGGAIGLEREIKGKPAGLRTNILICAGAALLTDVSRTISVLDGTRIEKGGFAGVKHGHNGAAAISPRGK